MRASSQMSRTVMAENRFACSTFLKLCRIWRRVRSVVYGMSHRPFPCGGVFMVFALIPFPVYTIPEPDPKGGRIRGATGEKGKEKGVADMEHRLWYKRPAEQWEEALPVGNGRLGAMVFGKTGRDVLQLNED